MDVGTHLRTFPTGPPTRFLPRQVVFAERGKAIVAGSDHGAVYVFDRTTGAPLDVLRHVEKGLLQTVAVSEQKASRSWILMANIGNRSRWVLSDCNRFVRRTGYRDPMAEQEAVRRLFQAEVNVVSMPHAYLRGAACDGFGHNRLHISEPGFPSKQFVTLAMTLLLTTSIGRPSGLASSCPKQRSELAGAGCC